MAFVKKISKKTAVLSVLVILLVTLMVGLVLSHRAKQHSVTIPSVKSDNKTTGTSASKSGKASSNNQAVTPPASDKASSSGSLAAGGTLSLDGAQTFVSNHKPGQNGTSTAEQSVCNTTPGATCQIRFTKDGVTKSLEVKTTDSNGVAVWSWDVKDAGFSSGSWQVSAVAGLNGQTKTVTDPTPLEIQ